LEIRGIDRTGESVHNNKVYMAGCLVVEGEYQNYPPKVTCMKWGSGIN